MPPRKVDTTKIPTIEDRALSSRAAGIIASLPTAPEADPVTSIPSASPPVVKSDKKEENRLVSVGDMIERARTVVNLTVQAETTLTIQSLGRDIFVVNGEVQVLKGEEFKVFISKFIKDRLSITDATSITPLTNPRYGAVCQRNRCSRRLQFDNNDRQIRIGNFVTGDALGCLRVNCSTARPTPRRS